MLVRSLNQMVISCSNNYQFFGLPSGFICKYASGRSILDICTLDSAYGKALLEVEKSELGAYVSSGFTVTLKSPHIRTLPV